MGMTTEDKADAIMEMREQEEKDAIEEYVKTLDDVTLFSDAVFDWLRSANGEIEHRKRMNALIRRAGEVRPKQTVEFKRKLKEKGVDRASKPEWEGREFICTPKDGPESLAPNSRWPHLLEINPKTGVAKQTISNCRIAIQASLKLHDILRRNEFTDKIEVEPNPLNGWKREDDSAMADYDLAYIKQELERGGLTREDAILGAITIEARRRSYHPIRDCLNELKWDKKDHISELLPKYLGAEKCEYTTVATTLMFGGIINRVFTPGCKFDTMTILIDDKQGGGKSTLCRLLAIKDEWYTPIKDIEDEKRTVETMMGHLIVEMEELEGIIKAKNIETARAFLSRQKDPYRAPYDRFPKDIPRQSICIGTSNDVSCLPKDRAGNRRFIPIKCSSGKAQKHPLDNEKETRADIMQCYAQAMEMYRNGQLPTKLPAEWEKKLPETQQEFMPEDTKAINIAQWLDTSGNSEVCVQMVFQEALKGVGQPAQWEAKEIAKILDTLTCRTGRPMMRRCRTASGKHKIKPFGDPYGRQKAWEMTEEGKIERWITHSVYDQFSVYSVYRDACIGPMGVSVEPTDADLDMIAGVLDRVVDDDEIPMLERAQDAEGKTIWKRRKTEKSEPAS